MAPGLQAILDGIQQHADSVGSSLTMLNGADVGRVFVGIISTGAVIDPDAPLGADPRMIALLEVTPQDPPGPVLSSGALVQTEEQVQYKVIALLDNNAASFSTRYRLEQQL